MKLKRSILAPLFVAVVGLTTGGWFLQRGASPQQNVYLQARLFEEVMQRVSTQFVEEKDPGDLYRMAIDGLLEELGDPHTAFLTPEDYEQLHLQTSGEYGGVGMQIDVRDGWVTVIAPLPNTPADRAGLRAGDRIIEIDDVTTEGWTTDRAVSVLRGRPGEPVRMEVARYGVDEPIPFRIVREEIHVKSVPSAYMIEDDLGYIELITFATTSTDELRAAIAELQGQGMRGVILDLRRNPGGLLDQGVSVTDLFLDEGAEVVETRSRAVGFSQTFRAENRDFYPELPMVVLVGPSSASASEILAGALQDHDRALVLGRTTYGKGSVQTLYELSGGNYLKLTTGKWYTPSGRSIQKPFDESEQRDLLVTDSVDESGEERTAETTPDSLQYRTDAGRIVYGGGGIHPDLVVRGDTTTLQERALFDALESYGSEFYDALYGFSIEWETSNPELRPGFPVTDAMMDAFHQHLQAREIDVPRAIFDGAEEMLGERIAQEITRAKWGDVELRKRINADDRQVRAAIEVLRAASTPLSVFQVAQRLEERYRLGSAGATPGAESRP
ncbi:MAG: S41 family peptidase [Longimicrobiales bacterium]